MHQVGRQRFKDFKALRAAIKSGDVAAAQKAFETLKKDLEAAPNDANAKKLLDPTTSVGKDFASLADALKAGQLDGIQKAFSAFQQDLRAERGHRAHGHRHPDNDGDGDDTGGAAKAVNSATPRAASTQGLDAIA